MAVEIRFYMAAGMNCRSGDCDCHPPRTPSRKSAA